MHVTRSNHHWLGSGSGVWGEGDDVVVATTPPLSRGNYYGYDYHEAETPMSFRDNHSSKNRTTTFVTGATTATTTATTTRSTRRCSTKGTGRVDSPAVLFPYFVHQAHHTSSMVERRPEARPRSACGRGFRPVFGRSRPGSFLDFLRSKTRKDSFLLSCFQWSICKGQIYFFQWCN